MDITVHFCGPTVKELRREWHAAVQRGQSRLIRHVSALLEVGAGVPVAEVAEHVGVSPSTVYRWLQAFIVQRWDSLRYGTAPGRPCKLTPTQKDRLKALVTASCAGTSTPTARPVWTRPIGCSSRSRYATAPPAPSRPRRVKVRSLRTTPRRFLQDNAQACHAGGVTAHRAIPLFGRRGHLRNI